MSLTTFKLDASPCYNSEDAIAYFELTSLIEADNVYKCVQAACSF